MGDISNQQLMDAIDKLTGRFDKFEVKQEELFAGVSDVLQTITDNMVTKDDLKNFELKVVANY